MRDSDRKLLFALVLAVAAVTGAIYAAQNAARFVFSPTPSSVQDGLSLADAKPADAPVAGEAPASTAPQPPRLVADALRVPWSVVPYGDGGFLVTERPGFVRWVQPDGPGATFAVPDVSAAEGEGGLMGMLPYEPRPGELHLYLYMTARDGGATVNRIVRYRFDGESLRDKKTIIDGIPAARYHDGGALAFGPDGMLYATTGDAGAASRAQDVRSLAGKILRLTPEGDVPSDNPFGNAVWSYGHRNPQGIAWDDKGRMWSTEHGRSGAASGYDELNAIVKGGNYGWPDIQGDAGRDGMIRPVAHSGPNETWAPASLAWHAGKLYFGGLRGESLYEATPSADGATVTLRAHFRGEYGRIRTVAAIGGRLYLTTSNTDGRGTVRRGDDRLIEIDPRIFDAR